MNRHRSHWSAMGSPLSNEEIDERIAQRKRIYDEVLRQVTDLVPDRETQSYVCKKLIIDLHKYSVTLSPNLAADLVYNEIKTLIHENTSDIVYGDSLQQAIITHFMTLLDIS